MSPPALVRRHGFEMLGLPVEDADPGRPVHLVAGERVEVAVQVPDVHGEARRRLRAVHEHRHAPRAWASAMIFLTGLSVPSALETWDTATIFVFFERRFSSSSRRISPRSLIGAT